MSDTATILFAEAYSAPGSWIRVDSGMYIREGDQRYQILNTVGLPLHDYYWMPDSGKYVFQMVFPPISRSAAKIDLIEGRCNPGGWHIWDIQLKGGREWPVAQIPEEVRQQKPEQDSVLPDADWGVGVTGMNVHLSGYRPEMGKLTTSLYVNEALTGDQVEYMADADSNGVYHFEFDACGTTNLVLASGLYYVSLVAAPGEDMEVYVDLCVLSRKNSRFVREEEKRGQWGYATGKYAVLNRELMNREEEFPLVDPEKYEQEIAGMNGDEYGGYLLENYNRVAKSIEDSDLPVCFKAFSKAELKGQVVYYMEMRDYYLKKACMKAYSDESETGAKGQEYKVEPFTEEQWSLLKELDLNNGQLFFTNYLSAARNMLCSVKAVQLERILGTDRGTLFDLQKVIGFETCFQNMGNLSEHQQTVLDSIENPFYKEAFDFMEKRSLEKLEANKLKTGYRICEVPKVSGFVYLTGESSLQGTWMGMIPDIKGDHYRLSEEQWDSVCRKFGIDGIPSYVLADKTGNYKLRNDLRDHGKLRSTLLEEAGK